MGYEGVKAAVNALQNKLIQKRIDTGVYVITRDNLYQKDIQRLIRN